MSKRILWGLVGTLALAAACDIINEAQAHTVMVATFFGTPAVTLNLGVVDAGGFVVDAGSVTFPAQTVAALYLGKLTSLALDKAPTPITDATVTLGPTGGSTVTLDADAGGFYVLTSLQNSSFQYQGGSTYDFTAVEAGVTYIGEVGNVPSAETIAAFPAPPALIAWDAGTDYTFVRPDPPTTEARNLGFVTVFPVSPTGTQGSPTYTNVPAQPLDFLKLIAAPSPWKQSVVTVPGTAFPQPNTFYLLLFEGVKMGGPKSSNLFIGSAILAGNSQVAIVQTNP